MTIRHVVLDRDGVLNVEDPDGGYVLAPEALVLIDGAVAAVEQLRAAGIELSVATNQSCVGRGLLTLPKLESIHAKLRAQTGIERIYACPHAPDARCRCRKPGPELLERAIADSGIAAQDTIFIGDSARDLEAADKAGITGWLVRTGKGRATEQTLRRPVPTYDDLRAAVAAIVADR